MQNESIWLATLTDSERRELVAPAETVPLTSPDVLVVGGGLVGLAIAYYLAEARASVQLITAGSLADGASGTNAGGIWPNDQGLVHSDGFQPLAFQGRDLWGRLSLQPGFDIDWRVNGFLNVNRDKFSPNAVEFAKQGQERGFTVGAVDETQIKLLEPQLRPGLTEGLHLPSEAHLHPVKAALSLARGARRKGAIINTGIRATRIHRDAARVTKVETTAGTISPKHVVVATGWEAKWLELEQAVPAGIPLRPVKGQLVATDPLPPLIKSSIAGDVILIQLKSGEIIAGASVVESDSLVPDPQASEQFIAGARALLPALRDVPFTRVWCGIRPGTPDGLPIIDQVPGCENLWLCCGHYRNGVLLAPISGKLLANWITRGERAEELLACRLDRFRV